MKLKNISLFAAVLLGTIAGAAYGQATLIAHHLGATDPTTEGFSLLRYGTPSLVPVTGDLGRDAWSISLTWTNGDIGAYFHNLTSQQRVDASAGWTISATLRIVQAQPLDTPSYGIFADFLTGTEYFVLKFGARPNGDPIVMLRNASYTLSGAGSGYHNYQVRYDAATQTASLWVDGTQRLAGIAGDAIPSSARFGWGGGQNPVALAMANWNEVSLSVIPEPSSLGLLALGGSFCAVHLLRMRRAKP